jgi:hypothetical protein
MENKSFLEKIKEERTKPVRINAVGILYACFAIGAFVLVCLLAFYILKNISLMQTDPCRLCESAGNICSRIGS